MDDEKFMRLAIEKAKEGVGNGQTPFGACIVKDGKVVSCEHNTVFRDTDITAHAEINAIQKACKKLKTIDLSGCVIYSTCEPCPMCFSACHWARISRIYFGARIEDAKKAGFHEIMLPNSRIKEISNLETEITGDFLREECVEIFRIWSERGGQQTLLTSETTFDSFLFLTL